MSNTVEVQSPLSRQDQQEILLFKVIKRNGEVVQFDMEKIKVAMRKAYSAVEGNALQDSSRVLDQVAQLSEEIWETFVRRTPQGSAIQIEQIQDQVELALMRAGEHKVARVVWSKLTVSVDLFFRIGCQSYGTS